MLNEFGSFVVLWEKSLSCGKCLIVWLQIIVWCLENNLNAPLLDDDKAMCVNCKTILNTL